MRGAYAFLGVLLVLASCKTDPSPHCEDILLSPVDVDTTSGLRFSWERDPVQGFAVIDEAGIPSWELICSCPKNDAGTESCLTPAAWKVKTCLSPPVVYGEVPPVEALRRDLGVQVDAQTLTVGAVYTAVIWAECDAAQGDGKIESTDFTAPPGSGGG